MVLLAFFGFFNVYSLRVNLSVAIVAMTENRTVIDADGNVSHEQDFPWDSKQKGLILSSFFYGYIMTQFLGGYIGTKVGGNIVSHIFYLIFLLLSYKIFYLVLINILKNEQLFNVLLTNFYLKSGLWLGYRNDRHSHTAHPVGSPAQSGDVLGRAYH